MRRLLQSWLKDMRLSLRSWYIYMELIFALIVIAVVVFVVPENFSMRVKLYGSMPEGSVPAPLLAAGMGAAGYDLVLVDSAHEVRERVGAKRNSVGFVLDSSGGKPAIEFVLQGYESPRFRAMLEEGLKSALMARLPGLEDRTREVSLEAAPERLSDRVSLLPVLLALNAGFMGLFIIASYIFLDKGEGVIKALAVTPSKVWHYLGGKVLVMLSMGLACGLLMALCIAGAKPNYPLLILLLAATNVFGSALGLLIASFFDTMAKAMGWLYGAIIILGIGAISYYVPSFSPLAIRLLPSYPMIFAFRETLLARPDMAFVLASSGGFAAAGLACFLLANARFKKTLTV